MVTNLKYFDYFEKIQHGTFNYPIAHYHVTKDHPRYHMMHHWHIEQEIIIILSGKLELTLDGKEYTFDGIVNGSITTEKRGNSGFGYDPIFMPDTYTQTFAEMGNDTKNQISHRSKAVMKLTSFLSDYNC